MSRPCKFAEFKQPKESRVIIRRIMSKNVMIPSISRTELFFRSRTQLLKGPHEGEIFNITINGQNEASPNKSYEVCMDFDTCGPAVARQPSCDTGHIWEPGSKWYPGPY